nr:bis(5'-nucleosyl)-tetraphosphatase (symmetrical) YqeK [uncultured Sellimonas sp.]
MNERISKTRRKLKKYLDQDRYEHTLGVMFTAASLAMRYGENVEEAMMAGLLHDCAKCIPSGKKLKLCDKYHLNITKSEYQNPSLLHAKLGAFLAAKKYHITNQRILDAIACHTTGKPEMTLLDKIIYIADFMEPGRCEAPNLPKVRKLAFINIDECLFRILEDSLAYLHTRDLVIDDMTEKTYLYYKELLNK